MVPKRSQKMKATLSLPLAYHRDFPIKPLVMKKTGDADTRLGDVGAEK